MSRIDPTFSESEERKGKYPGISGFLVVDISHISIEVLIEENRVVFRLGEKSRLSDYFKLSKIKLPISISPDSLHEWLADKGYTICIHSASLGVLGKHSPWLYRKVFSKIASTQQ